MTNEQLYILLSEQYGNLSGIFDRLSDFLIQEGLSCHTLKNFFTGEESVGNPICLDEFSDYIDWMQKRMEVLDAEKELQQMKRAKK